MQPMPPSKPKLQDKALAATVVKKGLAKLSDIHEAVRLQILAEKSFGVRHSLGMVLFLRGVLDAEELRHVQAEVELVQTQQLRTQLSLGEVLVELKHCQPEHIIEALDLQEARRREGNPQLLGEVLLELGHIDQHQLEDGLQLLYDLNLRKIGKKKSRRIR